MARKRPELYGPDTHKRILAAWAAYKDSTRATQADGAKALGMGTSGFSQYLRAEIPLNTDFIIKFAQLVGVQPSELATELAVTPMSLRPAKTTLPVKLTLAGRKPEHRSILVDSVGVTLDAYAVEVDVVGALYPKGTFLIVSDTLPREGDLVIVDIDGSPLFGPLHYDEARNTWWVEHTRNARIEAIDLEPGQSPQRVSGVHYPEVKAHRAFVAA